MSLLPRFVAALFAALLLTGCFDLFAPSGPSVTATPPSAIVAGESFALPVAIERGDVLGVAVKLSLLAEVDGITAEAITTTDTTAMLQVSVGANVVEGRYVAQVVARSDDHEIHSAAFTFDVRWAALEPATMVITAPSEVALGGHLSLSVALDRGDVLGAEVVLALVADGPGITAAPVTLTGTTATLEVALGDDASLGAHQVWILASCTTAEVLSQPFALQVVAPPLAPAGLTVAASAVVRPGGQVDLAVAIERGDVLGAQVTLSLDTDASGITASPRITSAAETSLRVAVSTAVPSGEYAVEVVARSGDVEVRSATVWLEVFTGAVGAVTGEVRAPFFPSPSDADFTTSASDDFQMLSFAGDDAVYDKPNGRVVPGEVLVRLRADLSPERIGALRAPTGGPVLRASEPKQRPGQLGLWRADGKLSEGETIALAAALAARPDVASATPNWILGAHAGGAPSALPLQWHYAALGVYGAWSVERGHGAPVIVAVLDTGAQPHVDLDGIWLPGFDFVNLDDDPTDGGAPSASYMSHGTHVAGTIAMRSANDPYVAGVSQGAAIVPVKVLADEGQGSLSGLLAGMVWASGVEVPGYAYPSSWGAIPPNPNPARVINMSLGANIGGCPAEVGEITSYLASQGVVLVASAGNDDVDVADVVPASCPGVIAVGAVGPYDERAWYSNYGERVDVYAPGGDFDYSFRAVGFDRAYAAGVLSTTRVGANHDGYVFMQGTSMAAPHVAGVAALLLADAPTMSAEQVREALVGATNGMSERQCDRDDAIDCTGGVLDAARALGVDDPAPWQGAPSVALTLSRCTSAGCANESSPPRVVRVAHGALTRGHYPFDLGDVSPGTYRLDAVIEAPGTAWPLSTATQVIDVVEGSAVSQVLSAS